MKGIKIIYVLIRERDEDDEDDDDDDDKRQEIFKEVNLKISTRRRGTSRLLNMPPLSKNFSTPLQSQIHKLLHTLFSFFATLHLNSDNVN